MQELRDAHGELLYPTSDGEPMGETDLHRDMMIDLIEALREHFRSHPQTYVSGNILMYYEEGNVHAHLSPDVLVTLGIANRSREVYKVWEEGKAPDLVVEVTSRSTRLRDVGVKKGLYEALGVQEYILFDPRSEYLQPRFQVFRREGSSFLPVVAPEAAGYPSERLGLTFRILDGKLRIFDAEGKPLLTPSEQAERARSEARRADLEAQRAEQATQRAEQATQRAEQATQRAEREARRAEHLAERLRSLGVEPDSSED